LSKFTGSLTVDIGKLKENDIAELIDLIVDNPENKADLNKPEVTFNSIKDELVDLYLPGVRISARGVKFGASQFEIVNDCFSPLDGKLSVLEFEIIKFEKSDYTKFAIAKSPQLAAKFSRF
jgi:hypothetical protein